MSDFDDVLERLLRDGPFRSMLAGDPARALAGYRLSAEETELLRSQVSDERGGERTVELRSSKAGLFGLLGPLAGTGGLAPAPAPDALGGGGAGFGPVVHGGPAAIGDQIGQPGHLGPAAGPDQFGGGPRGGGQFGGPEHLGGPQHLGSTGPAAAAARPAPAGYHPHIDVNGDGKWDQYTAVQRPDGSVDIYADQNHDGRVDFIGHDRDGDGRVESADYDENFNGTFETHQTDTNGDGWLDTRTVKGS